MDAWGMVCTAVAPAQLLAQVAEDAVHLMVAKWQTASSTAGADEEWAILRRRPLGHVT
jgi:hypothetical protein